MYLTLISSLDTLTIAVGAHINPSRRKLWKSCNRNHIQSSLPGRHSRSCLILSHRGLDSIQPPKLGNKEKVRVWLLCLFCFNALKYIMDWTDACMSNSAFICLEYLPYSSYSTHKYYESAMWTQFLHPDRKTMRVTQPHTTHLWGCPKQHHLVKCHLNQAHYMICWCVYIYIISWAVSLLYKCYYWSFYRQKWPFSKRFPFSYIKQC